MITLKNVTKSYGIVNAVYNINFTIESGEIVGLLGPNGAGKTTIMNMITGYIEPTYGEIIVNNYNIKKQPIKVKQSIGYMPENIPLYKDLTVKEFLNYIADLKSLKRSEKKLQINDIIQKTSLTEVQNKLIRNLSRGFRQRTSLAAALIGNPKVLILDEPTVGLDPKQIVEIRELIKSLKKGRTIIVSSHILSEISQMCEKVIILNKGKLLAVDSTENIEKLSTNSSILLTVEDVKDETVEVLQKMSGIVSVELHKTLNPKTKQYKVHISDNSIIKQISKTLTENNIFVIELQKQESSLESVFLKLVSEDNQNEDTPIKIERSDKDVGNNKKRS